jgi:hypothetical protein
MNNEEPHLQFGPALALAGKLRPLLKLYPLLNTVQTLPQSAHDGRSQSVVALYSNISGGGANR